MGRNRELKIDKRVKIYGSSKDIETAEELIERFYPNLSTMREEEARIELQSLIDTENLSATLLINGNGIYSFDRIIRDIRRVKNNGMKSLTDRLYKFLSLCCGSIAHYNKQGWIETYPTVQDLRQFFIRNEFGQRVLNSIPAWKTDVKRIVREIEKILQIDRQ